MYVDKVKTKINGKPYVSVLLRESYREGGKVKKRTIANLSRLPSHIVDVVAGMLKGGDTIVQGSDFVVERTLSHGHVEAVLAMARKLGLHKIVRTSKPEALKVALAMIAARVIRPKSKLATARWWKDTTLLGELGLSEDIDEGDCYKAMDWLHSRQEDIERELARRHLRDDDLVLYDLTSTYVEGTKCPLAKLGYSRDGKRDKLQIQIGLLTDWEGRPVAVEVFDGNKLDRMTLQSQVDKVRERFGLNKITIVGDRGMIAKTEIDTLRTIPGVRYITAMNAREIRDLRNREVFQPSLFDQRRLAEVTDPSRPDERFVVCYNPIMGARRKRKREDLLEATEARLRAIKESVDNGRLKAKDKIALRVGKVVNKYKVAKHFEVIIDEGAFSYCRRSERIAAESELDGFYVIRTNYPQGELGREELVRSYKKLDNVERAFRSIKTVDLAVRPMYHRLEKRVRAHVFLCMLAYYVVWHLRDAWSSLLFAEESLELSRTYRDAVAPAEPSKRTAKKKATKRNRDGDPVCSFRSLIEHLASRDRAICRYVTAEESLPFYKDSSPTALQQKALALIDSSTIETYA